MFRSALLFYENCENNYTFKVGVCWENCHKDSTNLGAFCAGGGQGKIKKSYIPKSITNFSAPFPDGM